MSYRKRYIETHGDIPAGMELHHVLPKRLGGTDDLDNLVLLTREEHAQRHKELYEFYGDVRDMCAYYMLSGTFDRKTQSSLAGKIGGRKTFEQKLGIHKNDPDAKSMWCSNAGKIGGKVQAEKGLGFHFYNSDMERHKQNASKGGKNGILCLDYYIKQGLTDEQAREQIATLQSELGKKGGIKNKGYIWINDGTVERKYTTEEQKSCSVDDFLAVNTNFTRGRLKRRKP